MESVPTAACRRNWAIRSPGPNVGANGQEELAESRSDTRAERGAVRDRAGPNRHEVPDGARVQSAYAIARSPSICQRPRRRHRLAPRVSPSPTASPTPTPSPKPSASSDDSDDDSDATPTPSPGGMITIQVEPLPHDLPNITNPNPALDAHHAALCDPLAEQHGVHAQRRHVGAVYASGHAIHGPRLRAAAVLRDHDSRANESTNISRAVTIRTTRRRQSNVVQFMFNVPRSVSVRHIASLAARDVRRTGAAGQYPDPLTKSGIVDRPNQLSLTFLRHPERSRRVRAPSRRWDLR